MKKTTLIIAAFGAAAVCSAGAAAIVPRAVEGAAPAAEILTVETREYCESVGGSGAFMYIDQREITSSLPLVIEKFSVSVGDFVSVGDEIATVDRRSSAALIESFGQVKTLAIPASNLETALALIPEKITADCEGRVISTAPSGAAIQSGSAIASLAYEDELCVSAAISELDIAKIAVGQRAVITLAAYPDEEFTGTVTDIAVAARDRYNGAVLETVVDITVTPDNPPDNPDKRLKSGLSADVSVELSEPREICVVPYNAIGQDDLGEYVFVFEDGKSIRREITTGAEFADGAEIIAGVEAGERVFNEPEKLAKSSFIRVENTR